MKIYNQKMRGALLICLFVFGYAGAQFINISIMGNGTSSSPDISGDGRYVAFQSTATTIVSGDTNGVRDIFVWDRIADTYINITPSANSGSSAPSLSADGRYVAFQSVANNLVSGDTNGVSDIFLYDILSGTYKNITISGNAASGSPHISGNGKFIVFNAQATNLGSGDTNPTENDIFLYDVDTDTIKNLTYGQSGGRAIRSSISHDGNIVVFESAAANLLSGDTNGVSDIFFYNRTLDSIQGVTLFGNGGSDSAYVSDDGEYITFESVATNLVSGDVTTNPYDVFRYTIGTDTFDRVVDSNSLGFTNAQYGDISNGGEFVLFTPQVTGQRQIATYDYTLDQVTLIAPITLNLLHVNADGQFYVFESSSSSIVSGDTNGVTDVFIYQFPVAVPPVVMLSGLEIITINRGSGYADDGAVWTDNIDGSGFIANATSGVTIDSYTPPGTYYLEYMYTDSDGNTGSDIRTVIVSNPPTPIANDDTYTIVQDSPLDLSTPPVVVVANDGNSYVITSGGILTGPTYGSYIYTGFGIIYTPNSGYVGTDSFTYQVCNYINICDDAIVTITITAKKPSGGTISSVNPTPTPSTDDDEETTTPTTPIDEEETLPTPDQEEVFDDFFKNVDVSLFNPEIDPRSCFSPLDEETIYQGNQVSTNFRKAHQLFYSYLLTQWQGTLDYGPERVLIREEVARFAVEFAKNVLCRKPNQSYDGKFTDLTKADSTLQDYIKQSYEYRIFKGDPSGTFRPKDVITPEELTAIFVRLITNTISSTDTVGNEDWADEYVKFLNDRIDLSSIGNTRELTAEAVYKLYLLPGYSLEPIGYVIK